jgi:alpha-1,3-rhamnosyl/mannosyltransferase
LFVPSGAIAPGISIPSIPWVHDLTIYSHPEWFPQSFLRRAMTTRIFRHGVAAAPIVFAVSEDTKRELVRLFGSDADRVRVTYEGGDPFLETLYGPSLESQKRDAKRKVATAGIAHPFVLALGTVEPRKNLALLIAAWEDARISSVRPTDLVIAGRDGWNMEPVRDAIRPHIVADEGMGRLHRLEAVDDDMRRDLLLAADLVALPSLHEGFGLVALEAMQAGTALLASRAGAIPEVVGESGILIDPNDLGAWKDALVRLMSDDENRTEVARLGKARSQGFTWDRAAKTVIEGLEGIV